MMPLSSSLLYNHDTFYILDFTYTTLHLRSFFIFTSSSSSLLRLGRF